jgi:glutathione S-transferase
MSPLPKLSLVEIGAYDAPAHESLSPYCLKAHRALKYLGLPYERKILFNPSGGRQFNPTGQFPTLLVGDERVPDSSAILRKLDQLSSGRLNPDPDPRVRAEALLWEELADTSVNGFLIASRWADDRNWPRVRDTMLAKVPGAIRGFIGNRARKQLIGVLKARDVWRAGPDACWRRFQEQLDQLEARAPKTGYWVGSALSVADLGLFGQLHSLRLPLTPWQSEEVSKRPTLSAYLDRIHQETWKPAATAAIAA